MKKIILLSFLTLSSLTTSYAQSNIEHNQMTTEEKIEKDLDQFASLVDLSTRQKNAVYDLLAERYTTDLTSEDEKTIYLDNFVEKIKSLFKKEQYDILLENKTFKNEVITSILQ